MKYLYTLLIFPLFIFTVSAQTSRVQFINNSGDSMMKYVKVFDDITLLKDSLSYKKGTAFMDVTGNASHTIIFRSNLNNSKFATVTTTFEDGKKYVLELNGVSTDTFY